MKLYILFTISILQIKAFRYCLTIFLNVNNVHKTDRTTIYLGGRNFREFFFGHFAGIDFREFDFTEGFAGINFHELRLAKYFAGINFRESALYKDIAGVNLTFALKKMFPLTLVYGFENNLSKNQYLFT